MNATWIEREDGTHVLLQPGRSSILAEIAPDRNTYKIYVLNRMRMTVSPIDNVDKAKSIALELIRKTVGKVLVSIADEPKIPIQVAVVPCMDGTTKLINKVFELERELAELKKKLFCPFPHVELLHDGIVKYTNAEGEISYYDAAANKVMSSSEYLAWCNKT